MPATATITSYYTFAANTKARASYVNTNFSNYRGHIVPIEPLTITANNLSYDLGSSEYRWRSIYCRDIDFRGSTTTAAQLLLRGDTSASNKALVLDIDSVERYRFGLDKCSFSIPTTTGYFDHIINGTTISSLKVGGVYANTIFNTVVGGITTTSVSSTELKSILFQRFTPISVSSVASAGGIAQRYSSINNLGCTTSSTQIASTTITITTLGNPIEVCLAARGLILVDSNSSANKDQYGRIIFTLNGVDLDYTESIIKAPTSGAFNFTVGCGYKFYSAQVAGTYNFSLAYTRYTNGGVTTTASLSLGDIYFSAREILN